jgi:hypothetical protein
MMMMRVKMMRTKKKMTMKLKNKHSGMKEMR